jgi:hypothetical protein
MSKYVRKPSNPNNPKVHRFDRAYSLPAHVAPLVYAVYGP